MTGEAKKILVSGIKPTGRLHIGNYFGAIKQYLEMQDSFESYIFIADFHALTTLQDPRQLAQNTLDIALDYIALGLDPKSVTIFKQSDVPQVAELAWIFNCITTLPYLERAHAFKDAKAKGQEINVGTFDYPMLMAADIVIYGANTVPVGQDQKQHIEFTRDTVEKFNRIFGETFTMPEGLILKEVETIAGTDGRKMSKSYGNTISLFASDEEIEKAVMGIVTDSGKDIPENVYAIHKLFRPEAELKEIYETNKGQYKILKEKLIEDVKSFIAPLREKREKLAGDTGAVKEILKAGGKRAREIAESKMEEVRTKVGLKI